MEITLKLIFWTIVTIGGITYLGIGIIFCFFVESRNENAPLKTPLQRFFGILVWLPTLPFWIYEGTTKLEKTENNNG